MEQKTEEANLILRVQHIKDMFDFLTMREIHLTRVVLIVTGKLHLEVHQT